MSAQSLTFAEVARQYGAFDETTRQIFYSHEPVVRNDLSDEAVEALLIKTGTHLVNPESEDPATLIKDDVETAWGTLSAFTAYVASRLSPKHVINHAVEGFRHKAHQLDVIRTIGAVILPDPVVSPPSILDNQPNILELDGIVTILKYTARAIQTAKRTHAMADINGYIAGIRALDKCGFGEDSIALFALSELPPDWVADRNRASNDAIRSSARLIHYSRITAVESELFKRSA